MRDGESTTTMTRARKLIVAGCSFSDRFHVEQCYGEILADKVNLQYLHQARACGSNYAIWRRISTLVLNGTINSDDVLLIQYTEFTRNEFATWIDVSSNDSLVDRYDDETWVIRYKIDIDRLYHNKTVRHFLKKYNDNFVQIKFEEEKFRTNNFNFQCMLALNKINAFFLNLNCYAPDGYIWYTIPYFKDRVYADQVSLQHLPYCISEQDPWHMSQIGHQKLAGELHDYLQGRI